MLSEATEVLDAAGIADEFEVADLVNALPDTSLEAAFCVLGPVLLLLTEGMELELAVG